MKKIIITLAIVLFFISYIIVCIFGQEKTIAYDFSQIKDIKVECNKKIITCKKVKNNNGYTLRIKSVSPGKTKLKLTKKELQEDNSIEEKSNYINIYVHPLGVVTVGSYLGKCNGDVSFLISFYIIAFLIIIDLLRKHHKRKKKNLYSYKNVKSLGLIIFMITQYLYSLGFFIYDYLKGYNQSLEGLIVSIKDNMVILIIVTFPLAVLVTILVVISNFKLMIKEGKSFKNMLGILLGGSLCLMIILNTLFNLLAPYNNIFISFSTYVIYMFIMYLECILLATCIFGFKAARRIPKFDKDYIIILGCKIRDDGTLPPLLKSRVDKAIEFSKIQKESTNKDIKFVPSGGKGNDEVISEAEAMKNYLLEQGINKKNILIEDKSTNTYENIKFSNKLINDKNANICFSTTNYHVFRAGVIATNQKIFIEGIGSKTKTYYWINAFIREFVATLVSEKKSHIKVLIILIIILAIFFGVIFIARYI